MKTKFTLLLLLALFTTSGLFAQEICDNGLDDDGDGLIDLNDTTDCNCPLVSVVTSLFDNFSFDSFENDEDCASNQTKGAPDGPGQADCIASWTQASDATTDAWHLLTYNDGSPNWPGAIPEPIPSGLGVAGMFIGVSNIPDYREYLGSCLPDGPVEAGEEYRINFQMGFADVTGDGSDTTLFIYSPPANMAIYGIRNCDNLRFEGNTCPEQAFAFDWELITTFDVSGTPPEWVDVTVDFIPTEDYAAIAIGGSCEPVTGPPGRDDLWRRYYFFDDIILNRREVFENTLTVGTISLVGTDICDEDSEMRADLLPGATYQWYRNGIAIPGATNNTYYPPLDTDFPGLYSVRISQANGCGIAGPVELIRPVVTNAFQDSVALCPDGSAFIRPISEGSLVQEYLWEDGSSEPTLLVSSPGEYRVTITSFCEQTIETINVIENAIPTYEFVIEPPVYCAGDTLKLYFTTDWQLDLIGFGAGLPINLGFGDTAFFVPQLPSDVLNVFVAGDCIGNRVDEYFFEPSGDLSDGLTFGTLSCANPTTTIVPNLVPGVDNYNYQWFDEMGNIISTDSILTVAAPGTYRVEVGADGIGCTEEETATVIFDEAQEVLNSAQLVILSCAMPTGQITVLLNDPVNTRLRWEDPAGNFLGDTDTLPISAPGTYILTGYLIAPNSGDTVCVQVEDYTIPFQDDGNFIEMADVPTLSCGVSSGVLSLTVADPAATVFVWRDGSGNELPETSQNLTVTEAGDYSVQAFLLSTDGDTVCRGNADYTVLFDDTPGFITVDEVPELSCANNSGSFQVSSVDPANTRYEWTDFLGNFISDEEDLFIDGIGNYFLNAYLLNAQNDTVCRFREEYVIDIIGQIEFILDRFGTGCEGETQMEVTVPTPGDWTYTWSGNGISVTDTVNTIVVPPGDYTLEINNLGDCRRTVPFQVDSIEAIELSAAVSFPECPTSVGDSTTFTANLVLTVDGGEGPFVYDLDDSTVVSDLEIIPVNEEGTYLPRVIDRRGCIATGAPITVTFPDILEIDAGVDQRINLGDSTRLQVLTNGANVQLSSINWTPAAGLSCSDCPNPVAGPVESVNYFVTYTTTDGCTVVDEIRVGVVPTGLVYIPNAFSPNFDGVNDLFQIFPDPSIGEVAEFRVYDRWGGMVYEQNGLTLGWDGRVRGGQFAAAGTYVYFVNIRLLNGTEKEYTGTVNLLR
ncbi:MAG: gliding motility-associated C-terminal domain-containing protein [Bacteroidota bacterium]